MSTSVPTLAPLPSSSSATGNANSKPKRRRSNPKDDNPNQENPPRPRNSFFLFFAEKRGARPDKMPLSSYARQTGLEWRALPPEEREVYEKRAEQEKLEHARMYPEYRYKPRKGGTKRAAWGTRAQKRARKSTTSPSKGPSLSLTLPPVEAVVHPVQHTCPGNLSQSSGFNGNGPADDQPTVDPSANLFSPEQHELLNRTVEGFYVSDYSPPLIPEVDAAVRYSPMSQVEQIWHHLITEPLVLHQSFASSSSQSSLSSCSQSPLSSVSQSPFSSSSQSPPTSPSLSFTSEMGINSFHHSHLPSSNWDSFPPEEMYPPFMGSLEDFIGHAPLPPHHDSHPSSLTSSVLDTDPLPTQYFHTSDPAELLNAEVMYQNSELPESLPAENQPIADLFSELYPWAVPEYSVDSGVFAPGYGPEPSFIGTWSH
ncbi:hypothetical protein HETIRDRAFT_453057 [Heterobasidion irregulare TC 32-1]|uniref:HMG box domain-containing protein n=1 Tax=Heterobasidion irregulare (strain TC 32-1) TaxID=747525 RepID=W4K2V5_HETIT|nr:uncharacterized protein HETIRDRAFT_453057 [Heterobasidion irregulare TC 32-1]ETW80064.1 hypothetical protein HETIRDRAFT_453057 [Heterobasidion irregulare TC 32-1]